MGPVLLPRRTVLLLEALGVPLIHRDSNLRVRELHPAVQAYEAQLSAGSPAVEVGSRECGMGNWFHSPTKPHSAFHTRSSQGEIRTLILRRARRSERRVYPNSTTWLLD
jgi:hypothetical protein